MNSKLYSRRERDGTFALAYASKSHATKLIEILAALGTATHHAFVH
jgi:hypothetical protein